MIIVNSRILEPNVSTLSKYWDEYQKGLKALQLNYPNGEIKLRRTGFPAPVKQQAEDAPLIMRKQPAPIYIKLTRKVDGVKWSYVMGDHEVKDNGLVVPSSQNDSIELAGEFLTLNWKSDPDYAFFFWFKSGQIGNNFYIFDPEGDELKEVKRRKEEMRVRALIWNDFDENKVKLMCEAYGISLSAKGVEIDTDILRKKLEARVFALEAEKNRDKTNLMAKGIVDFLADAKADEFTRPKAIIQRAIDDKVLTYKAAHFYMGDLDICFVPIDHQGIDKRQDYLAKYFRTTDDGEKWTLLLQAVVDKPFIDSLDKYGTRWLAEQMGIRLNQQADVIKQQLYEKFGIKVEADVPNGTT